MNIAGQQLLPGATFTLDEDRGVRFRHLPGKFQQRAHARVSSNDLAVLIGRRFRTVSAAESCFDQRNKLAIREWLDDKIVGTNFHRLYRFWDGCKSTDHNEGDILKTFQ